MDELSILVIAAVLGIAVSIAVVRRRQIVAAAIRFFDQPASAFNLAVLRVAFFGFQLCALLPPDDAAARFSRLPRGLLIPPQGLGGLFVHLPVTPTAVHISQALVVLSAALACVGLWTRVACAVFAVSALYYLGVPQLYGKVDHDHHVLWMAAILAAAPSGDVLSLDSVRHARRRAPVSTAAVGIKYALPIRFVWLMLGLIYLFPGVAKYYASGLDYLRPATLEYFWHDKWWELGNWRPIIRLDKVPLLLSVLAGATVLFETTFLACMFSQRLRPIAAVAGLAFHNGANLFMRIPFWSLQVAYIAFVDWARLSKRYFAHPRSGALTVEYARGCGMGCRTVRALDAQALPGSVTFAQAADATPGLLGIRVCCRSQRLTGFRACRRLAWRLPLAWPLLPLMYLPLVPVVASAVYTRVTASRTDSFVAPDPSSQTSEHRTILPVISVGVALVAAFMGAGATKTTRGWPVSAYPAFARPRATSDADLLVARGVTRDGRVESIDLRRALPFASRERIHGMTQTLLMEPDATKRLEALRALARYMQASNGGSFRSVTLWKETVSIRPDEAGRLLQRTPLVTIHE